MMSMAMPAYFGGPPRTRAANPPRPFAGMPSRARTPVSHGRHPMNENAAILFNPPPSSSFYPLKKLQPAAFEIFNELTL